MFNVAVLTYQLKHIWLNTSFKSQFESKFAFSTDIRPMTDLNDVWIIFFDFSAPIQDLIHKIVLISPY